MGQGGGICTYTAVGAISLEETIIAFSVRGGAVRCNSGVLPTLSCCDLYGNEGGDWEDCVEEQYGIDGNICADPLFCDADNGDFTLDCNSPCAAENNPDCGQIGAWPVGCGQTAVQEATWGAIKAMFRVKARGEAG